MSPQSQPITEEQFFDSDCFRPVANQRGDGTWGGTFHETYGEDWEAVRAAAPSNRVWTLVESDGCQAIVAGLHWVNRLGYFITEVPWESGNEEVVLEDLGEADDD